MSDADPHALIVSRNTHTAKGVCTYFNQRGVATSVIDKLGAATEHDRFTAVVVFPDEFPQQSARDGVRDFVRRFSRAWILVVTRHPAHFDPFVAELRDQALGRVLVLPRPVWGWALLDRVVQPPPAGTIPDSA